MKCYHLPKPGTSYLHSVWDVCLQMSAFKMQSLKRADVLVIVLRQSGVLKHTNSRLLGDLSFLENSVGKHQACPACIF